MPTNKFADDEMLYSDERIESKEMQDEMGEVTKVDVDFCKSNNLHFIFIGKGLLGHDETKSLIDRISRNSKYLNMGEESDFEQVFQQVADNVLRQNEKEQQAPVQKPATSGKQTRQTQQQESQRQKSPNHTFVQQLIKNKLQQQHHVKKESKSLEGTTTESELHLPASLQPQQQQVATPQCMMQNVVE